jgi:hypothetical protein
MKGPVPGATYENKMGNMYLVHFVSTSPDNGEEMVIFEALYGTNKIHHCPMDKFMEEGRFILAKPPKLVPMD